jgi:hypothetical protein
LGHETAFNLRPHREFDQKPVGMGEECRKHSA